LDKENVDPDVFRKHRAERGMPKEKETKPSSHSRHRSESKENATVSTGPFPSKTRKRTLSQFIEEKERFREKLHRSKANAKMTNMYEHDDSFCPYPREMMNRRPVALGPMSSPRQVGQTHSQQHPLWPRVPRTSASSPPKPPRYIVPDWAKTKTATQ